MKNLQTFNEFLNESEKFSYGKITDKLTAMFTKETGIELDDEVKMEGKPGKWRVTRIWAPQDKGAMNPGLHMEITQRSTTSHWMVMDDDGKLSDNMKKVKKV